MGSWVLGCWLGGERGKERRPSLRTESPQIFKRTGFDSSAKILSVANAELLREKPDPIGSESGDLPEFSQAPRIVSTQFVEQRQVSRVKKSCELRGKIRPDAMNVSELFSRQLCDRLGKAAKTLAATRYACL
jgi:hypothetical protein